MTTKSKTKMKEEALERLLWEIVDTLMRMPEVSHKAELSRAWCNYNTASLSNKRKTK